MTRQDSSVVQHRQEQEKDEATMEQALTNAEYNDDLFNLQLAAELGKTLLERNQELEESARKLHTVIEEQSKEIEYLTAQTSQLRDANEARLRIYEALEQSVSELERNNRSLQDVGKSDKKRIQALCASLELVEQHCEELQEEVDTMRVTTELRGTNAATQPTTNNNNNNKGSTNNNKGSTNNNNGTSNNAKRRAASGGRRSDYTSSEESSHTDEESGIHGQTSDESDFAGFEDTPLELQEVLRLRSDLARLRSQISREQRMRESLSGELERSVQENERLREELLSSRERERLSLNIQMDMGGANLSHLQADAQSGGGLKMLAEECEMDGEPSAEHQSAAAADAATDEAAAQAGAEGEEGNTLLFELDMQYRVLIEKYEALLEARRRDFEAEDAASNAIMSASMHSSIGGESSCFGGLTTASESNYNVNHSDHDDNKSIVDGSSSSLASNNELRCDAACQTDIQVINKKKDRQQQQQQSQQQHPRRSASLAPVPAMSTRCSVNGKVSSGTSMLPSTACLESLSAADQETFNRHFEHSPPEYKKLFAEIFAVLKRKVAEMPVCATSELPSRQPTPILPDLESRLECNLEKLKATVPPHVRFTRSYAEVVRARQQQAQQIRAQAQRNMLLSKARQQHC